MRRVSLESIAHMNRPCEGNSQTPITSSAPQPSLNETMPHMKKAARGRPLKIRKTGNIPHGIGTFWSPFTDRPFEVFGNRVYDRSDLNPHPPQPPQPPGQQVIDFKCCFFQVSVSWSVLLSRVVTLFCLSFSAPGSAFSFSFCKFFK